MCHQAVDFGNTANLISQGLMQNAQKNELQKALARLNSASTPVSSLPQGNPNGDAGNLSRTPELMNQSPNPDYLPALMNLFATPGGEGPGQLAMAMRPQATKLTPGETTGILDPMTGDFKPIYTSPSRPPQPFRYTNAEGKLVEVNPETGVSTVLGGTIAGENLNFKKQVEANKPPPAKGAVTFKDDSGKDVVGLPVYNATTKKWEINEVGGRPSTAGSGKLPKSVQTNYDEAQSADQVAERMKQDVDMGNAGNPQADQDMLARHLSLTFGQGIKGMRINKDLIQQHMKARGLPEDFAVLAAKIQNGETLSPGQRQRMYELGLLARESAWKKYYRTAKDNGIIDEPTQSENLPQIPNPYKNAGVNQKTNGKPKLF